MDHLDFLLTLNLPLLSECIRLALRGHLCPQRLFLPAFVFLAPYSFPLPLNCRNPFAAFGQAFKQSRGSQPVNHLYELRCARVAPARLAKLETVVHQISAPLKLPFDSLFRCFCLLKFLFFLKTMRSQCSL